MTTVADPSRFQQSGTLEDRIDWVPLFVLPTGLAIATFAAATPWLHAFRAPAQAGLLVTASVVPVAVTFVLAGLLRRPAAVSYGASAAGLGVLLALVSGLHIGSLETQLAQVPDRLITETLPVSGSPVVLAPVLALTWLCGAAAAELAYRGRRQGAASRTALVVPVVSFVVAYSVAAASPSRDSVAGAVLLVALALTAFGQQEVDGPEARRRRVNVGWLGGTAVLAAVLTAVIPSLGALSGKPASLNKPAPITSSVIVDPVGATATLRDGNPSARAFRILQVTSDRPVTGYISSAVLDDFDGSQWTFDSTFEPTGGRVPSSTGASPGVGVETVDLRETVESALPGGLLPGLDRPVFVRGSPIAADRLTAMILPRRVALGSTFEVTSTTPVTTLLGTPTVDGIDTSAGPSSGGATNPDLALPPNSSAAMSASLRFVSRLTGARPAPTVAFLQTMLDALRSNERQLSPYAPGPSGQSPSGQNPGSGAASPPATTGGGAGHLGGTSLSEVINAITVDRSATPEQFATFFALVARYIGVPARIATGFRFNQGSAGLPVPAGTHQVDNRQAWTWVEIPVSGRGWVVTDPTPDTLTGAAAPAPEQAQAVPTTLAPNKADAVPRNAASGGHAIAKPVHPHSRSSGGLRTWPLAVIAGVGLLALVALLGPGMAAARRYLRSRRRRSNDPALLAAGAWLELLDGLDRAGMAVNPGSTSCEITTDAVRHFGSDVDSLLVEVAMAADRALFSTLDPPNPDEAARAWDTQRQVTREVLRGLDRRQRARALVSVGSSPRRPQSEAGP